MKKLYLINQYVVLIFNSLCLFNINIIGLNAIGAYYGYHNSLETSKFVEVV